MAPTYTQAVWAPADGPRVQPGLAWCYSEVGSGKFRPGAPVSKTTQAELHERRPGRAGWMMSNMCPSGGSEFP